MIESNLYEHYKGGIYRLMHQAFLAVDGKEMAVYRSLANNIIYVRPITEFMEDFNQLIQKNSIDSDLSTQNINKFLEDNINKK